MILYHANWLLWFCTVRRPMVRRWRSFFPTLWSKWCFAQHRDRLHQSTITGFYTLHRWIPCQPFWCCWGYLLSSTSRWFDVVLRWRQLSFGQFWTGIWLVYPSTSHPHLIAFLPSTFPNCPIKRPSMLSRKKRLMPNNRYLLFPFRPWMMLYNCHAFFRICFFFRNISCDEKLTPTCWRSRNTLHSDDLLWCLGPWRWVQQMIVN